MPPKTALITGLNGTLAPKLRELLTTNKYQVTAWDRNVTDPNDYDACYDFISELQPNVICHLAMGDEHWAKSLGLISRALDIQMLFTSTAMVFNCQPNGPHSVNDKRTALDDYGQLKIRCEDALLSHNPAALIVRIGWQIDWWQHGNNMYSALQKQIAEYGEVNASEAWIPATSFMKDTCIGITELMEQNASGVYHLDGNQDCALTFAEIVRRIAKKKGHNWAVKVNYDYAHDQRLLEDRIKIPSITSHL